MMTASGLYMELVMRVGAMPTIPCEHSQHDSCPQWHEDGNEHYIRVTSPCGHSTPDVMVVCEKWISTSTSVVCGNCGLEFPAGENITDLGKVSDFNKVP